MGNIKPRVIPYGRESVRIGTLWHFARNVPGLGSVMSTESDQSSGNRQHGSSPEEERQRTGLFRWDDPENLVPPWSVPPGLMIPGPRQPQADDSPEPARQPAPTGKPRTGKPRTGKPQSQLPTGKPRMGQPVTTIPGPAWRLPRDGSYAHRNRRLPAPITPAPRLSVPKAPAPRLSVPTASAPRTPGTKLLSDQSRAIRRRPGLPAPGRTPALGGRPSRCPRPAASRTDPGPHR